MKILLINLPRYSETKDYTCPNYFFDFMRYPPLGLLAIATGVDSKHQLEILDTALENLSFEEIIEYVSQKKPDLLGVSLVTRRLYGMHYVVSRVKDLLPGIKVVIGGPHVNTYPKETMGFGFIDYVLPGFGEITFPQLVEAIANGEEEAELKKINGLFFKIDGKINNNPLVRDVENLDDLPFPNRKLINLQDYYAAADRKPMTTIYSSRGCPFQCIYCDVQEKKWLCRSAVNVVDEFEEISDMGIKYVHVFDDSFNINRQRVIDICNEIIRRGLKITWSTRGRVFPFDDEMAQLFKESGGNRWHIGVETFDREIMKSIKKGITIEQVENFFKITHKYSIDTMAYFMIGFPNETAEYRKQLYNNVIKLRPTYVFFNILYPLPKTKYYESLLKEGIFKEDYWDQFAINPQPDYAIPYPRSEELQEELVSICNSYSMRFYFRPTFLLKEIWRSIFYPKVFFMKVKGALVMIYEVMSGKIMGLVKSIV
jgi:anaerobic magnesium-protoporphyrin IX monomethyl ester cyclase